MLKILLLLLISIVLFARMVDGVAILVKDQPITLLDVKNQMQKSRASLGEAVRFLIREQLEKQEVQARHITVGSQEVYAEIEKMAGKNNLTLMQLYDAVYNTQKLSEKAFKETLRKRLLNQKLYSAIAFSQMSEPTPDEEEEYYRLHPEIFTHPESFDVNIYTARSQQLLKEKIDNPMFYAPAVKNERTSLRYDAINPRLAEILMKTPLNSFSPVLPGPQGGYMSFYVEQKSQMVTQPLEKVRRQISNMIMGEKREQVLGDYFDRLRLNSDIQIIRLPDENTNNKQPSLESWMQGK